MRRRTRRLLPVLCAALAAALCPAPAAAVTPAADECLVYKYLLMTLARERGAGSAVTAVFIVVSEGAREGNDYAGGRENVAQLRTYFPGLDPSAIDSFRRRNTPRVVHRPGCFSPCPIRLASRSDTDALLFGAGSPREALAGRYPGAVELLSLSRPGVSADGTQAFVFYGTSATWVDGSGFFVFMQREDDRWEIRRRLMVTRR